MKAAAKVVKFETCVCPGANVNPGTWDQQLARSDEARTDNAGKVIAVTCGRCQLPVRLFCRVCPFDCAKPSELEAHLAGGPCGKRDLAWAAQQHSGRRSKKAHASQIAMFPDDPARPSRMKAAR